jgi:hypothetical protein
MRLLFAFIFAPLAWLNFRRRQSNDVEFSGGIGTFQNRNSQPRPPALFNGLGKVISSIERSAPENSFSGFVEKVAAAKSQFGSVENPASKNSLDGHGGLSVSSGRSDGANLKARSA